MMPDIADYHEFDLLAENAAEIGRKGALPRRWRVATILPDRTAVSAIKWEHDPQLVFLHGGGQNAHTWDTVILALGVSALAIDLPGHGHSDWREDRDYWPVRNADAVAKVMEEHAPSAIGVVGMSLGGLTTLRLAAAHPRLLGRAAVIDVTPSVFQRQAALTREQQGTTALVSGPREFDDLEQVVELTALSAPQRSRSSIRRGVLHNTRSLPNGKWAWRYDQLSNSGEPPDFEPLWQDLAAAPAPISLITGGDSQFVDDADRAHFLRLRPDAECVVIPAAGHSVQSDQPLTLARHLAGFLLSGPRPIHPGSD